MRIFARNHVIAKSRFWYFMKRLSKAKKSGGELLALDLVKEDSPLVVKNFGIWFRYQSNVSHHNLYKEYRDVTLAGAVKRMYMDMAGRQHAQPGSIQIINTTVLKDSECKREYTTQLHGEKIKFPIVKLFPMLPRRYRRTLRETRWNSFRR